MNKLQSLFAAAAIGMLIGGCQVPNTPIEDREPPAPVRGVLSTTGDTQVFLDWYPNHERDLVGYRVYRSDEPDVGYVRIASTRLPRYVDENVVNGATYFYAVTAYDDSGNESELSPDLVHDTPRPEGYGTRIYDFNAFPDIAGYDFSGFDVRHFRNNATDIYFEYHQESGGYFLNAFSDDTDIQDYGFTETMDDVSYAPDVGWSQLGYVEAIPGHTYIIWTHDNHFAKVRVTAVSADLVEFDWAYQTDVGNPELKAAGQRPPVRISIK